MAASPSKRVVRAVQRSRTTVGVRPWRSAGRHIGFDLAEAAISVNLRTFEPGSVAQARQRRQERIISRQRYSAKSMKFWASVLANQHSMRRPSDGTRLLVEGETGRAEPRWGNLRIGCQTKMT